MDTTVEPTIRPYSPTTDADDLWALKQAFELGLGEGTGDDGKSERYESKLTDAYREGYLEWVERCRDEEPEAVTVAAVEPESVEERNERKSTLVGYVFVLPESLAYIWDAAILNEIYVTPDARGTGVADALMERALAVARAQDLPLERLVLDVDRENDRAQAFYERHGFAHWGEMVARELGE
ncbi:GNAT family N-acetyltransferase [Natronosalvus rutilus]|uniref:GNAT family N-acetyltransferase n=1 Tax=Natronosalvus rutilus TaxID=2953753 RepID=A0A9E7SU24_9EURY|nr:GNAT family N-acetyltransferase [Natronosalvus rutilus]UTF52377.1 GNAT family N-acetyltransferase [Natronosalvus rutilus]